ncbi:MAG: hypothetical protein AAFW73_04665 [Bacteroidota bacterium]
MKDIVSFPLLLISLAFCFGACQKELDPTFESTRELDRLPQFESLQTSGDADAQILIKFNENFEQGARNISAEFAAVFLEEDTPVDAGLLRIGDEKLEARSSSQRYITYPDILAEEFLGQSVMVSLQSDHAEFAPFETSVAVSPALNVRSSIGWGDYLFKDQDLELTWDANPDNEWAYLAICAEGVPCILREVADNGQLVVEQSAFANFPVGAKVLLHLGRGIQKCFGDEQQKICITTLVDAKAPGLEVR